MPIKYIGMMINGGVVGWLLDLSSTPLFSTTGLIGMAGVVLGNVIIDIGASKQ